MARQNNEDPAVSHSHRKVASTRTDEPVGGEKGGPGQPTGVAARTGHWDSRIPRGAS